MAKLSSVSPCRWTTKTPLCMAYRCNAALRLAREELNHYGGPQITFIIEDDQSTVEGAKAAFNKLIHQNGVSIITGVTFSTQLRELIPIVEENGVVCFSSLASAAGLSALSDFVFRTGLTTDVLNPNGVPDNSGEARLSTGGTDI